MRCYNCDNEFEPNGGVLCEECWEKQYKETHLTHDRYIIALKRIREQIKNGSKLKYKDSNVIGDKYITCSWGLCSMYKKQWPDKEDILRTYSDRRVETKQQDDEQNCPMDSNQTGEVLGCFYRCRVFQHRNNLPLRDEALKLYDITIRNKDNG